MTAAAGGEQQAVLAGPGVFSEVFSDQGELVRRYGDVANAGVGLRCLHDGFAVHADDVAAHMNGAGLGADVAAAQLDELAEPQAAPGGEQDITRCRGGIARTRASSSARVAGLICLARLVVPAPRMWQGLDRISSSRTAWPSPVRSRP